MIEEEIQKTVKERENLPSTPLSRLTDDDTSKNNSDEEISDDEAAEEVTEEPDTAAKINLLIDLSTEDSLVADDTLNERNEDESIEESIENVSEKSGSNNQSVINNVNNDSEVNLEDTIIEAIKDPNTKINIINDLQSRIQSLNEKVTEPILKNEKIELTLDQEAIVPVASENQSNNDKKKEVVDIDVEELPNLSAGTEENIDSLLLDSDGELEDSFLVFDEDTTTDNIPIEVPNTDPEEPVQTGVKRKKRTPVKERWEVRRKSSRLSEAINKSQTDDFLSAIFGGKKMINEDTESAIKITRNAGRSKSTRSKRRKCGVCDGCTRDDCGKCKNCLDKPKFGGPNKMKQKCILKSCSNFCF